MTIIEWIGRLLGRKTRPRAASAAPGPGPASAAAPPPPRLPPAVRSERRRGPAVPDGAGSRSTDRRDIFDPRAIGEFDPQLRGPLPPGDAERLGPLREQTLLHFHRCLEAGLPLPPLAQRLLIRTAFHAEGDDVNLLVQLVHQDPALSAQVLRAANAAAFAGHGEVRGVREAVMRLGLEAARQVALTAVMNALLDEEVRRQRRGYAAACRSLWLHSMSAAPAAGWLAMSSGRGDVESAFVGAMLHDIGKIFVLRSLGAVAPEPPPAALIDTLLEDLHVEAGAALATHWKLPGYVAAICRGHHGPLADGAPGTVPDEVHIVRVVSGLDELRVEPGHRPDLAAQVLGSATALRQNAAALRALFMQLCEARTRAQSL